MDTNTWLLIAIIAFLVFCCLPMLFMGKHRKRPSDAAEENTAAKEEEMNSGK